MITASPLRRALLRCTWRRSSRSQRRGDSTAPAIGRQGWVILLALYLSTAVNYVDRMALSVVAPQVRSELDISATQYGSITTVFLFAYMIGQLAGGVWIDRVGVRRGLAVCVTVWSVAAIGHAAVTGVLGFLALRFLLGLSEAGNWPAGAKAISEWLPKERRAFAMGFFDSGSVLGGIIAPPLVAGLAVRFGWRYAFVLCGLLGFLWLIAWAGFISTRMAGVPAAAPAGARHTGLAGVLRRRDVAGLVATRALATPVWWFYVFWLPDYLHRNRGFSVAEIGAFGWIPFLTAGAGTLIGGMLSDCLLKKGLDTAWARKCVMAGAALCMLAGIRVVTATTGSESLAWSSFATFGFGLWSANILALHGDVIPPDAVATAVGLTGIAAGLGGALFSYSTGVVVDAVGYTPVFWAAGLASILACIPLFALVGRPRQQPPAGW